MSGENERVPALFPDYGQGEWQSVGRILLKGYQESSIYPLELSFAHLWQLFTVRPNFQEIFSLNLCECF